VKDVDSGDRKGSYNQAEDVRSDGEEELGEMEARAEGIRPQDMLYGKKDIKPMPLERSMFLFTATNR